MSEMGSIGSCPLDRPSTARRPGRARGPSVPLWGPHQAAGFPPTGSAFASNEPQVEVPYMYQAAYQPHRASFQYQGRVACISQVDRRISLIRRISLDTRRVWCNLQHVHLVLADMRPLLERSYVQFNFLRASCTPGAPRRRRDSGMTALRPPPSDRPTPH